MGTTVAPPPTSIRTTLIRRLRPVHAAETQIEVRTEKSVRTATSKSVIMQTNLHNVLFSKRNGLLASSAGNNETEAIIRGYCKKAPMESQLPHCFRPEPLYFYNVTSALCEPFYKGHCARSRNKFDSVQTCQERCILTSAEKTTTSTT